MICFENVSKIYTTHVALNNVSFELPIGKMAFLTGHSGAGKTTLLKLISLIERPTQGQIFIHDYDLNRLRKSQIPLLRRHIGIIFQNPQLLPQRTVFENVALPLVINRFRQAEIQRRVRAALGKVGLLDKEAVLPETLSAGEQQRVGIARAVVNRPAILLADEPTGNLDPHLAREIMQLFAAFNAVGTTVLIATHDLALVAEMNYPALKLKAGQLVGEEHD